MTLIIGISGITCSGKTTLSNKIVREISDGIVINQDDFYKDLPGNVNPEKYNFDVPDAINFDKLYDVLTNLMKGNVVEYNRYDSKLFNHNSNIVKLHPAKYIVVEGIFILTEKKIRDLLDIKIFIETEPEICLLRRIEKDQKINRTFQEISERYIRDIIPGNNKYIKPHKHHANIIVNNSNINSYIGSKFVIDGIKSTLKL